MGSRGISTTARGLPLHTHFLQSRYPRRIFTTYSTPAPIPSTPMATDITTVALPPFVLHTLTPKAIRALHKAFELEEA